MRSTCPGPGHRLRRDGGAARRRRGAPPRRRRRGRHAAQPAGARARGDCRPARQRRSPNRAPAPTAAAAPRGRSTALLARPDRRPRRRPRHRRTDEPSRLRRRVRQHRHAAVARRRRGDCGPLRHAPLRDECGARSACRWQAPAPRRSGRRQRASAAILGCGRAGIVVRPAARRVDRAAAPASTRRPSSALPR